jgi:hypothetical protein
MSMLKTLIIAAAVGLTAPVAIAQQNLAIYQQFYGGPAYGPNYNHGHDVYETGHGSWTKHSVVGGSIPEMPVYSAGRGTAPVFVPNGDIPALRVARVTQRNQIVYEEKMLWDASTQTWVKALIKKQE